MMMKFDEIIDDEMVIRERLKMAAKEAAAIEKTANSASDEDEMNPLAACYHDMWIHARELQDQVEVIQKKVSAFITNLQEGMEDWEATGQGTLL